MVLMDVMNLNVIQIVIQQRKNKKIFKTIFEFIFIFKIKNSYKAIYKLEHIQKLQRGTFRYKV